MFKKSRGVTLRYPHDVAPPTFEHDPHGSIPLKARSVVEVGACLGLPRQGESESCSSDLEAGRSGLEGECGAPQFLTAIVVWDHEYGGEA